MLTANSTSLLDRCKRFSIVCVGMSPRIAFNDAMEAWSLGRLLDMTIKLGNLFVSHKLSQFITHFLNERVGHCTRCFELH